MKIRLLSLLFASLLGLAATASHAESTSTTTTTTLTSAPDPSVYGQPVTFFATVSGEGTPTGSVTFIVDDEGSAQTVPLDAAGQALAMFDNLSVGTHSAIALYSGDEQFSPSSSATDNHTVNAGETVLTLSVSPSPASAGELVTVTASVAAVPPAIGTPTGEVVFTFPNGSYLTASLDATGEVSISTTTLTTGTITASYDGAAEFSGSTGMIDVTIELASSTTVVSATPNPSVYGQSVTVSATVTSEAGTPRGTVTFTGAGLNH